MLENGNCKVDSRVTEGSCEVRIGVHLAHERSVFSAKKIHPREIGAHRLCGGDGNGGLPFRERIRLALSSARDVRTKIAGASRTAHRANGALANHINANIRTKGCRDHFLKHKRARTKRFHKALCLLRAFGKIDLLPKGAVAFLDHKRKAECSPRVFDKIRFCIADIPIRRGGAKGTGRRNAAKTKSLKGFALAVTNTDSIGRIENGNAVARDTPRGGNILIPKEDKIRITRRVLGKGANAIAPRRVGKGDAKVRRGTVKLCVEGIKMRRCEKMVGKKQSPLHPAIFRSSKRTTPEVRKVRSDVCVP